VERTLGLMGGAGPLPPLVAARARAQGWRVVAFAFDGADAVAPHADRVIPSHITEVAPVLAALVEERVTAAVLVGRFAMTDVLRADRGRSDAAARRVEARAGSRADARLVGAVIGTLADLGIEVLDQRLFLGDLLAPTGCWTARPPTPAEWEQVRQGLALARRLAEAGVGQTVVLHHGAVTAVEAAEGTTEAIRRGTALGGAGAVIVKAPAPDHDYRVDTPLVGRETLAAAVAGAAAVVAVEAGRVALLDRAGCVADADAAGLTLVGVE
jgi:DUF1009 family protein